MAQEFSGSSKRHGKPQVDSPRSVGCGVSKGTTRHRHSYSSTWLSPPDRQSRTTGI